MNKLIKLVVSSTVLIVAALVAYLFVNISEPIRIGFVADLSTRKSQLGTMARNGILMAVDELNGQGGINGNKLELLVRDHKGDKEECFRAATDLADQDVKVIIGPLNSSMVKTVISATEKKKTLLISPTASTESVSGIDDYFLRINSSAITQGALLGSAVLFRKDKRVAIILDKTNIGLTGAIAKGFKQKLANTAVEIVYDGEFSDKSEFEMLAKQISAKSPDAILVLASGIDAAGIVQQYSKIAAIPNLYACMWSKTGIIEYGGKTVEGMLITAAYENRQPSAKEIEFINEYEKRYQTKPQYISRYSYEAVMLFAKAASLAKELNSDEIKAEILKMDKIAGISDDFRIDKYGDAIRQKSLFIIKDGKYDLFDISE